MERWSLQLSVAKPLAAIALSARLSRLTILMHPKPVPRHVFDNLHRPNDLSVRANLLEMVDPEGGAQDAHRFSTRQDAASKNPR
jgi:hypothetical protein